MKNFLLAAAAVCVCTIALAANEPQSASQVDPFVQQLLGKPGPGPGPGPNSACAQLNLTDAQKSQLKDALYTYQQNKIQDEANVKLAHLKFMKTLGDSSSTYEAAQADAQNVVNSGGQLVAADLGFRLQVLYQILTPDQRKLAAQCLPPMLPGHGPHGGPGGPGQHGPQGPGHGGPQGPPPPPPGQCPPPPGNGGPVPPPPGGPIPSPSPQG